MYHSDIKLLEGAFFISDAHYSHSRPQFLDFLQAIQSQELLPTQIIFMGDIFDALFGSIPKTYENNKDAINIINKLAQKIEVVYLEGNHDFNLAPVFINVKIFKIKKQPLLCSFKEKKVLLAHGDFDGAFFYKLYTTVIRNRFVLKFLNYFDTFILSKLDEYLGKKDDCKKLEWFDGFIKKRITNNYNCDYFIEGHFHQNTQIELEKLSYINLGAFACNQRYFIVELIKDKIILRENYFNKET